jgi:hypothetical protein
MLGACAARQAGLAADSSRTGCWGRPAAAAGVLRTAIGRCKHDRAAAAGFMVPQF